MFFAHEFDKPVFFVLHCQLAITPVKRESDKPGALSQFSGISDIQHTSFFFIHKLPDSD